MKVQEGSWSCCVRVRYSWSSLFPCLSKVYVVCGNWLWRDLDMSLGCFITYLRHSPGLWGGGVWFLAWRPLNISIPAIKYSMQWELESLQSLNYRSVLKCAFPSAELVEWNRLDQKDCGNFSLPFTFQDTYQQSAEYGLKQLQRVKRFSYNF